jgi:hypothetical protein
MKNNRIILEYGGFPFLKPVKLEVQSEKKGVYKCKILGRYIAFKGEIGEDNIFYIHKDNFKKS